MHHQRCHFLIARIEPDGIELIGEGIFLLEVQIHKILLRAVHEVSFFLNRFDELLIQSFAVSLVAHKSGVEIQRSVNYLFEIHLFHPSVAVFTFTDSEDAGLVL